MELAQEPSGQLDMARAINLLTGPKDLYISREILPPVPESKMF